MSYQRLLHTLTAAPFAGAMLTLAVALTMFWAGCGAPSGESAGATPDTANHEVNADPAGKITENDFRVRSELVFNTSEDLSFEIPGEVGDVNVAVGDRVSEGDLLAVLDEATVSDLKEAASQLKLELDAARDALDAVKGLESTDTLVKAQAEGALAKAESDLAQAQVNLDQAEERLTDFQFEHDLKLARARQARAAAATALDQADESLSDFAAGHGERFANSLEARSRAKVALENAEDALADYLPNYNESVTVLRNNISKTEQELEDAREDVLDIDADHADLLSAARQSLAEAEDELKKAKDAYAEFSVKAIEGNFANLEPGEGFDSVQHNALKAAVDEAESSVAKWEDEIDELEAGPKEIDVTTAKNNVGVLEERLARFNRQLADLQGGPDQSDIRLLEATVQSARERLERTERDLTEAEGGVDELELDRLEAVVESRRLDLDSAQKELTKLEAGPDQVELGNLNAAVDAARQAVITAREARDDLAAGPDAIDIAQAELRIETAERNYEEAKEDLDGAKLTAPFDGVVRTLLIKSGDAVRVDARVIEVVDDRDISVKGLVETNYIERIKPGVRAEVGFSNVSETVFAATVSEVSGEARTERGVISFEVVFSVVVPAGAGVPVNPGLVTTRVLP